MISKNSTTHLNDFLNSNQISISQELRDKIEDNHVIEIYCKKHLQLFRSNNFFDYFSYSPDILSFMPWTSLYHRSESEKRNLLSATHIVTDKKIECLRPNIKAHLVTELKTNKKFKYSLDYIGHVKSHSKIVHGYMTLTYLRPTSHINIAP